MTYLKPELIKNKNAIKDQITAILEIVQALSDKHLDPDDATDVIKDTCAIIPLMGESVGFQASIFFSSNGARPTACFRKLRKSKNSGKFYFGREVTVGRWGGGVVRRWGCGVVGWSAWHVRCVDSIPRRRDNEGGGGRRGGGGIRNKRDFARMESQ